MTEFRWTPSLVEERIAEAADTLRRLPDTRVQGHASTWPPMLREYWESYGVAEVKLRRPPPSAAAIDRMDEALPWLAWLDPVDARIVWLRASGDPWKAICWKVGLARAAAHQHWLFALCVIAWRLSGRRLSPTMSKRDVIAATRAAKQ